jgi:hypothetical protein
MRSEDPKSNHPRSLATEERRGEMKKRVLIGLIVGVVLVGVGALAVSASVETPIPYFKVTCSSTGQMCDPPYSMPVTTGGELQVEYDVPGHCSSIRLHILVDGTVVHTTGFLGWPGAPPPFDTLPLSTGLVNVGPVSPGAHVLGLQAEGQVGGCNGGRLYSWAGSGRVLTAAMMAVSVDIKPGSDPNCFKNDDHGAIPIALLGSADLDATQIDPSTVRLDSLAIKVVGKSEKLLAHIEDANGDGIDDLVVQIQDEDDSFASGHGTAQVTGYLYDGTYIYGSDSICVVP